MTDTYVLNGLDGDVEILVDRWGIPHIYASSARDAVVAQGFNAARDRLWQLDLWRRSGLGLLAEVAGPEYVERDRAARLLLYRGSMADERNAYGFDLDELLTPFVEGINAYISLALARPELLPPEFEVLDYLPVAWSPDDILRIRTHGRSRNLRSEVTRARILHEFGGDVESLRVRLEPAAELSVAEGLDLSVLTADVLRDYDLATDPALPAGARPRHAMGDGSNNWAIAPSRTASGRPILANDPHRALPLPALRYLVHVECPGAAFAGGGEPMLPGISFGHNGRSAFGLTVLPIDQEDLYVYELDDVGGTRYRYGSRWEPMRVEHESIPVRGSAPVEVELRFTRHGPVIHQSGERNVACALRAAWLDAGMVPYLGSAALLRSASWPEFRQAAAQWGAPGENLIYADIDGDIGWQAGGRVPIRPNWNGLLPVPGDGRYEWDGYAPPTALPHEHNPTRGWVATANQYNINPSATGGIDVAFEWESPFRQQRIVDVLERSDRLTLEDSVALQNDDLCLAALALRPRVLQLGSDDPIVQRAVTLLAGWDGRLAADSAAAALFEVWFRKHVRRALCTQALRSRLAPDDLERAVNAVRGDDSVVPDARIDLDLIARMPSSDRLLIATLREAMLELERWLGPDPARWHWGSLHRATFIHPLNAHDARLPSIGPQPRGGGCDTVANTGYDPEDFAQTVGATTRLVLDVGEWDNSMAMNAPGQSGHPASEHYADLVETWTADGHVPFLFSRRRVEAATRRRIVLAPARVEASPAVLVSAQDHHRAAEG